MFDLFWKGIILTCMLRNMTILGFDGNSCSLEDRWNQKAGHISCPKNEKIKNKISQNIAGSSDSRESKTWLEPTCILRQWGTD